MHTIILNACQQVKKEWLEKGIINFDDIDKEDFIGEEGFDEHEYGNACFDVLHDNHFDFGSAIKQKLVDREDLTVDTDGYDDEIWEEAWETLIEMYREIIK